MKKIFKSALLFASALVLASGVTSCSKSDDDNSSSDEKNAEFQAMANNLVDVTIKTTYKNLADASESLANDIEILRDAAKDGKATDAQVAKVCTEFKEARRNYELSEAFLLGAANTFNVDPHIDSWPLDLDQLKDALTSAKFDKMKDDDGTYVGGSLGQNVLGFHAIEFILFRDGENRPASAFNGNETEEGLTSISGYNELIYATAVAKDLRNNCYIMEIGWNPASNAEHKALLDDLELNYTLDSGLSFGEDFKQAKSYGSLRAALTAIAVGNKGAKGICDEVADTKMGKPYNGTSEEDINYIESPYSWNTITDFHNNIGSIMDVWYGSYDSNTAASASFSAYFKKYHQAEGAAVETAIADARTKIKAIKAPFVINYKDSSVKTAIDACHTLSDALTTALAAMQND